MLSYLNSQEINVSIWFHIICQKLSSAPLIMLILRVDKKGKATDAPAYRMVYYRKM